MANQTWTSDTCNTTNEYLKYKVVITETGTDSDANTSTVNVRVLAWRTNTGYTTNYAVTTWIKIDEQPSVAQSFSYPEKPISHDSNTELFNSTFTIKHDSDGKKKAKIVAWCRWYANGGVKYDSPDYQGMEVTLTQLSGEFVTTLTPVSVQSHSIQIRIDSTKECSRWSWSIQNGSSGTWSYDDTPGKSVTINIQNLQPDRTYKVVGSGLLSGSNPVWRNTAVYTLKTTGTDIKSSTRLTLFEHDTIDFSTNGIGALTDAISCIVTEERNGLFELEMEYPMTGIRFDELQHRRIILARPNQWATNLQPFRIYGISKPINGIVTVYAAHISYDLSGYTLKPFDTISTIEGFISLLNDDNSFDIPPTPFRFASEIEGQGSTSVSTKIPVTYRSLLGGSEVSILGIYGGEYEFDVFDVTLMANRGADRSVTIRYGKNLTDMKQEENCNNVYTHVRPYYFQDGEDETSGYVELTSETGHANGLISVFDLNKKENIAAGKWTETNGVVKDSDGNVMTAPNYTRILLLDLTSVYDNHKPSESELEEDAESYISLANIGIPEISLEVSFLQLSDSEEYRDIKLLERVQLCDVVTVEFPKLGVNAKAICNKTVYNVLSNRYDSIELGTAVASLSTTIAGNAQDIKAKTQEIVNNYHRDISSAASKITGNAGGYVVLDPVEYPSRILIMDEAEKSQAMNVWIWNKEGLAHLSDGLNGSEPDIAITQDGAINAKFIYGENVIEGSVLKAGTVTANEISQEYAAMIHRDTDTAISQALEVSNGILESRITESTTTLINGQISVVNSDISDLRQEVDNLSLSFTDKSTGGINLIKNSSGVNQVDNQWSASNNAVAVQDDEANTKTTAKSMFKLNSTVVENEEYIEQTIDLISGKYYTMTLKARRGSSSIVCGVTIYDGNNAIKIVDYEDLSSSFQEFSKTFMPANNTIRLRVSSYGSSFYVADMMLCEGSQKANWTPAPNEIYTENIRMDVNGINITNSESNTSTVINHEKFAILNNGEEVLTVNNRKTTLAETDVIGNLTIGHVQCIPREEGMDFVLLDPNE